VIMVKMPFNKTFVYKTDTLNDNWQNIFSEDISTLIRKQKFLVEKKVLKLWGFFWQKLLTQNGKKSKQKPCIL